MPTIDLGPNEYYEKGRAPPKQPIFLHQSEPFIPPGGLIRLALLIGVYAGVILTAVLLQS
jgi:hypothetical protein